MRIVGALMLVALLFGCGTHSSQAPGLSSVSGVVTYRERMMLPPDAVVTVTLLDVSKQDVAAQQIATETLTPKTAPPFAFELSYDPALVQPGMRYALRADVRLGDRLLFTTDTHIDPFANPGSVEILLKRVSASKQGAPLLSAGLWELESLGGEPLQLAEASMPPTLLFDAAGQVVSGSGGCNQFSGAYSTSSDGRGATLTFGNLITTLRACAGGMTLEQEFLQALSRVDRYRFEGGKLLLEGDDQELLRFGRTGPL